MKILKRIAAGVLAATIAAGSLTVGASAASLKMKLYTASIDKIERASDFWSIGDGYYALNNSVDPNEDPDFDQIVYIGKDELESWRKTGKISYKKVKTDVDMTDLLKSGNFTAGGNYMQFVTYDKDGNVSKRYVVGHNEKNTKITTAYTKGSDWSYTNSNGYTVEYKVKKNGEKYTAGTKYTVSVTAPDGTKKSKTLTYKGSGEMYAYIRAVPTENEKYVAYVAWKENEHTVKDGDFEWLYQIVKIYGVKKNGKFDALYTQDNIFSFRGFHADENWVSWSVSQGRVWTTVYSTDTGKMASGAGTSYIDGLSGKVYGTRAIAYWGDYYYLVDLSDGMINKLSEAYQAMSTEDGKIYLVKNEKGQWGYIDKKGKEIAMFDDAGAFIGDYAPVVKNGKAYLVDRNMKQVSEKIDADSVTTFGEGLFRVTKGDKVMLMTYKK